MRRTLARTFILELVAAADHAFKRKTGELTESHGV
jgi:hypothetical protein